MTDIHPDSIDQSGAAERAALLAYLDELRISTPIVEYPSHENVEEGKRLRGDLPGTFTKNLLLRDKKKHLYFVTAHEDLDIDLRTLHTRIGARGRLGFASGDLMVEVLHVFPGTATPLALFHDTDQQITLAVDETLAGAAQLNFHPMVQTESIGLSWKDFTTFASATGHDPVITTMSAPETN